MKPLFTCGGDVFETLALAVEYSNFVYINQGIILGIERVL